ncbi:hypothetical protein GM418_14975 [Maribellus comscasis]|uniref:Porin n=1 Tax=Maribellus comscasis TaxID=2681766 RepID=A0A6I6K4K2_9BACT|nr:hypothetical protein [Maribellus comscasis]QGY44924.1 hypothetical protein GM418_14975 [Maribellus comscasis]
MVSKLKMVLIFISIPVISLFAQDKPELHVGGALRFNYNLSSWKEGQKTRGGDFGYDLFRINAKAKYKGVKLNAEYRLYSQGFGGGMLKQGWVGYDFTPENNLQIGLTQVPFGITQYNSHNWFFSINYYLGLEDDHDMGLKYTHNSENWLYAFAFFKNAEELNFGNNSDVSNSRYSYDVSSSGDGLYRNKEINQLNLKVVRKFSNGGANHMLGVSAQYGGIYNLDTENTGDHLALAGHYELDFGKLNVKAQVSKYNYNTKNPAGQSNDMIAMTAYGAPYLVASEGTTYTLGVAYSVPVEWGPISNLQFYDDFGFMDKKLNDFHDSYMNVTGVLITAGNVYTYVDAAQGKDQPWLGPVWGGALSEGTANADWEMRFNINIGYYF